MRIALTTCLVIFSFLAKSQVYINEILASNQNDIVDEMLQTADWIEIYNSSNSPVDIAGYYLSDDELDLTLFQIPTDQPELTTLPANGHLIIWADNDITDGPLHASFRLSSNGESVFLTAPNGETILDTITYTLQQSDISYGRETDGASTWVFFNNTTPGAPNAEIQPSNAYVFINEVMAFNLNNITDNFDEHESWIEIYNPNSYQVNLANYYIGTPGSPLAFQIPNDFPALTTVDADGFLIFWMDAEEEQAQNHANFELSIAGGTVVITAPNGTTTINSYNYPTANLNTSWGRNSDGGLGSHEFAIPTPRVTNSLVIIEPDVLYINELMAANQNDVLDDAGQHEDWVEIYNPNAFPVDLGGYYFTDNSENPTKWMVPDNVPGETTVPAESWFIFWADEDGLQGNTHMSFRLNNQGEDLRMYGPDGFTLVDRIVFGYVAPDLSYGRSSDGAEDWILFSGTTPDASNNGGTIGITSQEDRSTFQVYPNPSSGIVQFSEVITYELVDLQGRMLMSSTLPVSTIDLSPLPNGQYILKTERGIIQRISKIN